MASKVRRIRKTLPFMYELDLIDELEFCMLYDAAGKRNPLFPYKNYERLNPENITNDESRAEFRFNLEHLPILAEAMRVPEKFICENGTVATGMEGLCILLRRFAYPCRYSDMISRFGRSVPELSEISSTVAEFVYSTHGHLLQTMNQRWLQPQCLQEYANAVHACGAALENCWGFIDGTVRPICRPGQNQRILYNGHKRVHAIKFQSVVAPNGLIAQLFGPVEGKRHDAAMLRMSGLLDELEIYSISPNGNPLCIYGDPAYPLRIHLQSPYRHAQLTPEQSDFNTSMSAVRVAVEWVFRDIVGYFAFLDYKKDLKIGMSPIGKMYTVCALLRNALACLYGSSTSSYFNLNPPTLEEYFT